MFNNLNIFKKQMKKKELYIKPVAKRMTLEVSYMLAQSTWTDENFSKKKVFDDDEEVEEW